MSNLLTHKQKITATLQAIKDVLTKSHSFSIEVNNESEVVPWEELTPDERIQGYVLMRPTGNRTITIKTRTR